MFAIPFVVDDLGGEATLLTVAMGMVALLAAVNLSVTGMVIVLVGTVMNMAPLVLNGAIPVGANAAVTVDAATFDDVDTVDLGVGRRVESDDDRLVFLGDTIPVTPLGLITSFGDLVIALGLANVSFRLLRPVAGREIELSPLRRSAEGDQPEDPSDPWAAMMRGEIDDETFEASSRPGHRDSIWTPLDARSDELDFDESAPDGPVAAPRAEREDIAREWSALFAENDTDDEVTNGEEPVEGAPVSNNGVEDEDLDLSLSWASGDSPTTPVDTGPMDMGLLKELLDESETDDLDVPPFVQPAPGTDDIAEDEMDPEPEDRDLDDEPEGPAAPEHPRSNPLSDFEQALAKFDRDRRR